MRWREQTRLSAERWAGQLHPILSEVLLIGVIQLVVLPSFLRINPAPRCVASTERMSGNGNQEVGEGAEADSSS